MKGHKSRPDIRHGSRLFWTWLYLYQRQFQREKTLRKGGILVSLDVVLSASAILQSLFAALFGFIALRHFACFNGIVSFIWCFSVRCRVMRWCAPYRAIERVSSNDDSFPYGKVRERCHVRSRFGFLTVFMLQRDASMSSIFLFQTFCKFGKDVMMYNTLHETALIDR